MIMKGTDGYKAFMSENGVTVELPDSNSPYVPEYVQINKDNIIITVWDEKLQKYMDKKVEWKDALIMHKALTRIFGRNGKRNK